MTFDDDSTDDIAALREFAARDAVVPPGFDDRMAENMWRMIITEEQRLASTATSRHAASTPRRTHRGFAAWLRPTFGTALAVMVVALVVVASQRDRPADGIAPSFASGHPSLTRASLADTSTLDSLLGRRSSSGSVQSPVVGVIDATSHASDVAQLAHGPDGAPREVVDGLPRDEHALIRLLRQATSGDDSSSAHDRDFVPFRIAANWIGDASAPPDLRAAFLRSLGYVDGIEAVGHGVDSFGRPGVIIARLDQRSGVRQEYVVAPQGGTLLEHREYTTRVDDGMCPAGTLVAFDAFDDAGNQIDQAQARWVAWPIVVTACDPAR